MLAKVLLAVSKLIHINNDCCMIVYPPRTEKAARILVRGEFCAEPRRYI